jgi:hypothetical protein
MGELDFTKYSQGGAIEVLPDDTYHVRIDRWEKCVAKTGQEQIRIYAKVTEGEHEGKPLIDHIALSEAAAWRAMWFINEVLVWDKEERTAVGKISIGSEKFNRCFDLAKGRSMFWAIETDPKYKNNKVKEYIKDEAMETIDPSCLEDVPEWVKNK